MAESPQPRWLEEEIYLQQPHAPPHLFRWGATYFLTARTLESQSILAPEERREQLVQALHFSAEKRGWHMLAWVVLSNHYHCVLRAPDTGEPELSALVSSVHRFTSRRWNEKDGCPGRRVWYQYWDTCITHPSSFFARLNYIHHNPVKHGLTSTPEEYSFSSYARWQETANVDLPLNEGCYPWDWLDLE